MQIELRTVTWYSKLLAAGLFIALPFAGFWLGMEYARSLGPLEVAVRLSDKTTVQSSGTPSIDTNIPGQEQPKTFIAKKVVSIAGSREFTFKNLPGATFRVTSIARLSGPLVVASCGTSGTFIFIPTQNGTKDHGTCIPSTKLRGPQGESLGAAAVTLEIENKSNAYISSRYLQMFYNPETGDAVESELAVIQPPQDAYGALPQSTRRVTIAFLIPENQEQVQLVYGDYGKSGGLPETPENLLGKSIGGYIVNFTNKTVDDIPG